MTTATKGVANGAEPKTLTRADLADVVHREVGFPRTECDDLVRQILGEISDTVVSGKTVKLSSFGSFVVRSKSERIGRNPKTLEEAVISPRRVVVFKPSNVMKAKVNGGPGGADGTDGE